MQITNPQWRLKLRKLVGFVDQTVSYTWMVKTRNGHHVYGSRDIPSGVGVGDRTVFIPLPLGELEWVSCNGETTLTGDGHCAASVSVTTSDQPDGVTIRTLIGGMLTSNLGLSWSEAGGQTGNIGPKGLVFELGNLPLVAGVATLTFTDYESVGGMILGFTLTTSAVATTRILVLVGHGAITDTQMSPDSPGLLSSSTYTIRYVSGLPSNNLVNNYHRYPLDLVIGAEISTATVTVVNVGAGDTITQAFLSFPGYFGP